jgi:hypothetical protein
MSETVICGSKFADKNISQILIFAVLYLFFIFIAQSWIATFTSYYQTYIIKKETPSTFDFLLLSLVLTTIFVVTIYLIRPTLPLFK